MLKSLLSVALFFSVFGAMAQTPVPSGNGETAKPSADKRLAPPEILDTEKYPFAQALKQLQKPLPLIDSTTAPLQDGSKEKYVVPSVASVRAAAVAGEPSAKRGSGEGNWTVPVLLHREVIPLSASAQTALTEGEEVIADPTMTTIGQDGRVMFAYGVGLPTIICAPLRVCTIELEPGEKIKGEPEIGDSTRWEIVPASSGSGDLVTPILVIKPHVEGLDTNLVVTTDKRTYYLRLVSKSKEYIARTAFTYKQDEDKLWQQYLQQQQQRDELQKAKSVVTPMAGDALDHLNFRYTVSGGSESIRPVRVIDDGVKTYITMPDSAMHRELPALVVESVNVKGEKGQEMVNYRVKDNIYIVDRLFDRAALILGVGKKADKVEIRRETNVSGGL